MALVACLLRPNLLYADDPVAPPTFYTDTHNNYIHLPPPLSPFPFASGVTATTAGAAACPTPPRFILRLVNRPVVFVGPFEHHSNLLPWRESCAEVVTIGELASGGLDLGELRDQLRRFASRKLKIGACFVVDFRWICFGWCSLRPVGEVAHTEMSKRRKSQVVTLCWSYRDWRLRV